METIHIFTFPQQSSYTEKQSKALSLYSSRVSVTSKYSFSINRCAKIQDPPRIKIHSLYITYYWKELTFTKTYEDYYRKVFLLNKKYSIRYSKSANKWDLGKTPKHLILEDNLNKFHNVTNYCEALHLYKTCLLLVGSGIIKDTIVHIMSDSVNVLKNYKFFLY